jgi:hypothetical protein
VTHVRQTAPSAPQGKRGSRITAISIKAHQTDFRLIPLGDLNLLQEIGLYRSATVVQKNREKSVRRMYSARVRGCTSNMVVALYQGNGAEDVGFLYSFFGFTLASFHFS